MNSLLYLFSCSGSSVYLVNAGLGDKLVVTKTDEMIALGSEVEQQKG